LTDEEHLIAFALLPQFKLNVLPVDARLSMKRQVLNYVQEVAVESHTEAHLPTADVAQYDDYLFCFMNSAGREAAEARQVEEFMESKSTTLLSLKDYPHCQSIRKGQLYTAQQCSCRTPFQYY